MNGIYYLIPFIVRVMYTDYLTIIIPLPFCSSNKKSNINKFSTPVKRSREYICKHYKQGKSFSERLFTVTSYTVPLGTLNENVEARFKALTISLPSPSVV